MPIYSISSASRRFIRRNCGNSSPLTSALSRTSLATAMQAGFVES
ncbi:hypothetical protein AB0K16_57750 [Nonomuraea jabiensis]